MVTMDPIRIQEINKLSQQYLKFENLEDIDQLNGKERVQILDTLIKFFRIFYYIFQEDRKKSNCQFRSKHSVEREKSDTDYTRPRKTKKKISLPCFKEESSKLESDIKKEKTTDVSLIILTRFSGFDVDDFDFSCLSLDRIHNTRSLALSLHSTIREYQLSYSETRKICEHTLFMIEDGIKMIDRIIETFENNEISNMCTVSDVENEFNEFSSNTFDVI